MDEGQILQDDTSVMPHRHEHLSENNKILVHFVRPDPIGKIYEYYLQVKLSYIRFKKKNTM